MFGVDVKSRNIGSFQASETVLKTHAF